MGVVVAIADHDNVGVPGEAEVAEGMAENVGFRFAVGITGDVTDDSVGAAGEVLA